MASSLDQIVNNFLYFGYQPPAEIPGWLLNLQVEGDHEYSVESAIQLLEKVFEESCKKRDADSCIVPISGGWDSRILLGLARERFDSSQIRTFSFGTKSQLDLEIGRKVAKKLGVEHTEIHLDQIELTWERLSESVRLSPWTYTPDAFFNRFCFELIEAENSMVLSGFMGDPLTGGHYRDEKEGEKAVEIFLREQGLFGKYRLTPDWYDPHEALPEIPDSKEFSTYDILDFGIRQAHCIAPIISSVGHWKGWDATLGSIEKNGAGIITPFTHPDWARYWIAAPKRDKMNRKLFLEVLKNKFPKLYRLPSKTFFGAKKPDTVEYKSKKALIYARIRLHQKIPALFSPPRQMLNYMDFKTAFKERDDYRELLERAQSFLEQHDIASWIEIDQMKRAHQLQNADLSKEFFRIIGLALNLEVHLRNLD